MNTGTKTVQKVALLYEDFFKTILRVYPLNDLDIIVGHYLIEKAKQGDMAKEEEDMSQDFNVIIFYTVI